MKAGLPGGIRPMARETMGSFMLGVVPFGGLPPQASRARFVAAAVSTTQILTELPRLSHAERREIVRRLIELEKEAQILTDCDHRADANFLLLDAPEAEDDERTGPRTKSAKPQQKRGLF